MKILAKFQITNMSNIYKYQICEGKYKLRKKMDFTVKS